MEVFRRATHIDFLGKRKLAAAISGALILAALASLFTRGLEFGIDFTGGVLVEISASHSVDDAQLYAQLGAAGFTDASVQKFGSSRDVLIRLLPREGQNNAELSTEIVEALRLHDPGIELRRVEFVGPRVGEQLREQGGLAMLFALILILAYVAFRFQWKFAVGAVAALAHDVIITVGFFSVFGLGVDLPVLAAVLAVIGYSLNDTIVVFDRIRENFHNVRKSDSETIMNLSINQTLSRTIMTGVTTLLVLLALYLVGGEVIHNFALALIVGIVIGTYSSVYVASAVALAFDVTPMDMTPREVEQAGDGRP